MDQEGTHKFRLDDFDPSPRVTEWHELPRIAAHVRWLKQRLFGLLPRWFGPNDFQRYQEVWDVLVDDEAEAWRHGYSAHGWFARQPQDESFERKPRSRAGDADEAEQRRQLLAQPYEIGEANGVPTRTGTEVMTVGPMLDDVERLLMSDDADQAAELISDADEDRGYGVTFQEVPVLLAAVAYLRVEDAVLSLLRGENEQIAWHLLLEATDLINRAERLDRLIEAPSEHGTDTEIQPEHEEEVETRRGVFHISDKGAVLIKLDGEHCRFTPRKGGDRGYRCIQAILKDPFRSVLSEMLAIDVLGEEPTRGGIDQRLPLINDDEHNRLVGEVRRLKAAQDELDKDADDYQERSDELEGSINEIMRDLTNRTYRGRAKLEHGPEQKRNRRVGAVLDRTIKALTERSSKIGEHLGDSLKNRHGDRPSYEPAQYVDWSFIPPEEDEPEM